MSSTGIALPEDFKTKVSSRVRDIFMDLIPDDTLNEMVGKEIKAFFEAENQVYKVCDEYGFGSTKKLETLCSPFRLMVWNEVRKLVEPKMQEVFNSDEWKTETVWSNDTQMHELHISELLDAKLGKAVTTMSKNLFRDMFGAAIKQAKLEATQDIEQRIQAATGAII